MTWWEVPDSRSHGLDEEGAEAVATWACGGGVVDVGGGGRRIVGCLS